MQQPLEIDRTYHIFNRANGQERLFRAPENYRFFLQKFTQYAVPLAEVYAYCLMPSHFQFLLKIKSEPDVKRVFWKHQKEAKHPEKPEVTIEELQTFISRQFSNCLNSYVKAFNKMYHRRGSLLMRYSKRKEIEEESHLLKLFPNIHLHPVEAGLVETPEEWRFSSYRALISNGKTLLGRKQVLEWFGDVETFKAFHRGG